ncbi:hypothetical protein NQZ68_013502 [Dissostichus eleginoides]|nr:hypothetical protein NQZ68_013502 [Dissostichus eleginoides]
MVQDLNGNNLTAITKADFSGLKHLRVLFMCEECGNPGCGGTISSQREQSSAVTPEPPRGACRVSVHLMENQISNVERGAFDELKELERLRLNKNHLSQFPELLFQKNELLSRL